MKNKLLTCSLHILNFIALLTFVQIITLAKLVVNSKYVNPHILNAWKSLVAFCLRDNEGCLKSPHSLK